jgi:predicted ATPase
MRRPPFLTKLTLQNFRSIRHETVEFSNPLVLVGKNGSGKSNFVDALSFLSDCVSGSLMGAMSRHNNLWSDTTFAISPQTGLTVPRPIGLRAEIVNAEIGTSSGHYAFMLHLSNGEPEIIREQCTLVGNDNVSVWYDRKETEFRTNIHSIVPNIDRQALVLPAIIGMKQLSSLRALAVIRDYAILPEAVRQSNEYSSSSFLLRNGSNLASVLEKIEARDKEASQRIRELLEPVIPELTRILAAPTTIYDARSLRLSLLFGQMIDGEDERFFDASCMSDGTLAVLGLIVAALQSFPPSLMSIEEPENHVHPGALDSIADIIEIAAQRSQVVITTHSPELLDTKWLQPENIRVVEWEKGTTYISKLGDAPVQALQQHLMGAGELLRANALDAASRRPEDAADLFDEMPV